MAAPRNLKWWVLWSLASTALFAVLYAGLVTPDAKASAWRTTARSLFLPGKTTHGHYPIELACEACHGKPFEGRDAMQKNCVGCHGAELKEARDSHPKSKFTDPRNAERAARLDAVRCVTCHSEHRPEMTRPMGVTLPDDYCRVCHEEVANDRPSHKGIAFRDCASAGCHNFHDNRALYEDFLVKHAAEPAVKPLRSVPARDFRSVLEELSSYPVERFPLRALAATDADARGRLRPDAKAERDWLETAHAKAGVNCSGCHQPEPKGAWVERPTHEACKACHVDEVRGFLGGKHGMKLAAGLGPMRPADARLPMRKSASHEALGCVTCHPAHRFDTKRAAAEACIGCHDDGHTRAYEGSPHQALWKAELAGTAPPGTGVSCATCHMPRVEHRQDDVKRVLVQHNQNDTLRPADKMIRPACLACHGLPFSLDAIADAALAAANYKGKPKTAVPGVRWALEAEKRAEESKKAAPRSTDR